MSGVHGKGERCGIWAVLALVIFSLLVLTTVYTSPLSTGFAPGSSLSKTTLKQRQSTVQELLWTRPVLELTAFAPVVFAILCQRGNSWLSPRPFFGRYFNLPPPVA